MEDPMNTIQHQTLFDPTYVGREFGVTRDRIRQLEGLALNKLRAATQERDTCGIQREQTATVEEVIIHRMADKQSLQLAAN
jgi:DNA-directed RNA polymerase sigma subunit (sigma70/sigma32)